jgi:aminocyclitol acetyltransferase
MSGRVSRDAPISFYLSKDALPGQKFLGRDVHPSPASCARAGDISGKAPIDRSRHFVVILAGAQFSEIRGVLRECGFVENADFFDCFKNRKDIYPTDIELGGTAIGKGSYFSFTAQCLKTYFRSVGRYCSINPSAQFGVNHQMNMVGTGSFYCLFDDADYQKAWRMVAENSTNSSETCKVAIGNDVWIGANVFINTSKCSQIGDGAIVGTGSIVLGDIPPYAVVYGAPARVRRYRYTSEQIETLLRVRWWDWDDATLRANAELLMRPDKFFEKFG